MKQVIITVLAVWAAIIIAVVTVLAGTGISPADLRELSEELPRHNSFRYINCNSLQEAWFARARRSLDDPNLYIVLSNTKSAASKLIARFTGDRYNHVSLAFDGDLATLLSYNGGGAGNKPGMNPESPAELHKNPDSALAVYRLPVHKSQKARIIERIERINRQGSAYNLLGLLTNSSIQPNIMFCSQFVYAMLDSVALNLFTKDSGTVKPMDFVTLDRDQHLIPLFESSPEKPVKNFQNILDSRSNMSYSLVRY